MRFFVEHLALVLLYAALVAVFIWLRHRNRAAHVLYWLIGWCLMLAHAVLHFVPPSSLLGFLRLSLLELTGVAFLTSVASSGNHDRQRVGRMTCLALPVLVYTALLEWRWGPPWIAGLVLIPFFAACLFCTFAEGQHRFRSFPAGVATLIFGAWIVFRVARGDVGMGSEGVLLALFALAGILFTRRFPRLAPGVVASIGGFFIWALFWGLAIWAPALIGSVGTENQLSSLPKVFLAFGMVLVLLEEESLSAQEANARERGANLQLQRFAQITSHLLGGVEVRSYCGRIAEVIAEATTFLRAAIVLADEDQHLSLCGHTGLSPDEVSRVQPAFANLTVADADDLCHRGLLIGHSAVILSHPQFPADSFLPSTRPCATNPHGPAGDQVVVPLRSPRGALLGLICLADPAHPERVNAAEISKIEMLAADIAVAVDNAVLHRQLVTSEKLAGLGRLVRGVAHEINNPLTAVLGYAELLRDQATTEEMRRGLNIIYRESQRIRNILQDLRRFAQQEPVAGRTFELLPLLQRLLEQKANEARSRGIQVLEKFPASLPHVTVEENQLRQVVLNVLHNAFDAVDRANEKRVTVSAREENGRILLTFTDTGKGFTDINRIFDPFFTTKSVGKGTGLGLSICYGLLKQHGGDITAHNLPGGGASITIELPAAATPEPVAATAP